MVLLVWVQVWCDGVELLFFMQFFVVFGISCVQVEFSGGLLQVVDYCVVLFCFGDLDELFVRLVVMFGEKVVKVKVGFWEVVCDGMVVNLLLEVIFDLQLWFDVNCVWMLFKV